MKGHFGAFTLIEVLVSIAIIAILSALILSSFRSAIVSAKATVCVSNLRQLHSAMQLYQQDFGEYPPMTDKWPGLLSYTGNVRLECPHMNVVESNVEPRLRTSYFIHAFFDGPNALDVLWDKQCMQVRGPSYPIAHDRNHTHPLVAAKVRRSFLIVLRLDGSVVQRPSASMVSFLSQPELYPCPKANMWSNF